MAFQIAAGQKSKSGINWIGKGNVNLEADTFVFITGDGLIAGPNVGSEGFIKSINNLNWTMNIRINSICFGNIHETTLKGFAEQNSYEEHVYDWIAEEFENTMGFKQINPDNKNAGVFINENIINYTKVSE